MPAAVLEPEHQQPIRELIAKAQEYPVVKLGISTLSSLPGASQVQKLSDPILNTVDHQLVRAYAALPFTISDASNQLSKAKQHVPESVTQWLTRVDGILTKARLDVQQVPTTITTTTAEVKQSIQAFYATSVDHFLVLAKAKLNVQFHVTSNNGETNGHNHEVTKDEFVNGLKAKLKHVWDDSLVAPAEQFYERAKTLYVDHIGTKVHALTAPVDSSTSPSYLSFLTNLRTQLGEQWEKQVVEGLYPAVRVRVSKPAHELYTSALNHYLKLRENQSVVKATEFITSYKQLIGAAWNDRLEQPLRDAVSSWKKSRTEDLKKLHDSLDYDQNGYLTVADLYDTSRSLVTKTVNTTQSRIHQTVESTQSRIHQNWQYVLNTTINTFDALVPGEIEEKPEETCTVTVSGVATHVKQRLKDRSIKAVRAVRQRAVNNVDYVNSIAQSRIADARHYGVEGIALARASSTRLAPYIRNIDLVNVAEDIITNKGKPAIQQVYGTVEHATTTVKASVETVQTQVKASVETVRTTVETVRTTVEQAKTKVHTTVVQPAYQTVQARVEAAHTQVRASLEQLQATLADVTAKAKSHLPVDTVTQQWNQANTQLQTVRDSITTRVNSTRDTITTRVTSTVDSVQQQPTILELQRKLRDTIIHAKSIVSQSNDYVLHTRISQFPTDFLSLIQQSRQLAKSQVQETSREAITRVTNQLHDVIASVQTLIHWKRVECEEVPNLVTVQPRKHAAPQGEMVAQMVANIEEKEAAAASETITSPIKPSKPIVEETVKPSPAATSGKKHKKKGGKHRHETEGHDE